ncbi:MAG: DUF2460 domain-containing protein [Fimbriimonadaceae bacterium]
MAGFHDVVFPPAVQMGLVGGPMFSTTVNTTASGHEPTRTSNWDSARRKWEFGHTIYSGARGASLVSFFLNRQGKAYGFRVKDWTDYYVGMAFASNVLGYDGTYHHCGTGDAATLTFQLYKVYADDPEVYVNQTLKTVTTDYTATISPLGVGTVVFAVAPANLAVILYNGVTATATADGVLTTFTFNSMPYTKRKITRPERGTIKVYLDGVLKTETTHYSINYSTGVITFVSAPGSNVKVQWAGKFHIPARFDFDDARLNMQVVQVGDFSAMRIIEIRE